MINLVESEFCLWQKKYVKIIYGSIIKSTLEDKNTPRITTCVGLELKPYGVYALFIITYV